jgi:hypothetical protein
MAFASVTTVLPSHLFFPDGENKKSKSPFFIFWNPKTIDWYIIKEEE